MSGYNIVILTNEEEAAKMAAYIFDNIAGVENFRIKEEYIKYLVGMIKWHREVYIGFGEANKGKVYVIVMELNNRENTINHYYRNFILMGTVIFNNFEEFKHSNRYIIKQ